LSAESKKDENSNPNPAKQKSKSVPKGYFLNITNENKQKLEPPKLPNHLKRQKVLFSIQNFFKNISQILLQMTVEANKKTQKKTQILKQVAFF
jgi:hypothetical protein